jgi:hypothetical protein
MEPFPPNANIPPIEGEYCYYHASKKNNLKYCIGIDVKEDNFKYDIGIDEKDRYICDIECPEGKVSSVCVHYSLPEPTGNKPWITQHEGVLKKITLVVQSHKSNMYHKTLS